MEDIISKYKKERKIKNIAIILTSLVFALGLNIFLSNTNIGKYLKTSVVNNQIGIEKKADLYLENTKNSGNITINLISSNDIYKVKSLSFSVFYNKYNVSIKDKKVNLDNVEVINLVENEGYNTIILNFKNTINIKAGENILSMILEKKDSSKKENIQLVNVNMIDIENNTFNLSTSGSEF